MPIMIQPNGVPRKLRRDLLSGKSLQEPINEKESEKRRLPKKEKRKALK